MTYKMMILKDNLSRVIQYLDMLLRCSYFKLDSLCLASFLSLRAAVGWKKSSSLWDAANKNSSLCLNLCAVVSLNKENWRWSHQQNLHQVLPSGFHFASGACEWKWDLFQSSHLQVYNEMMRSELRAEVEMSLYRKGHLLKLSELEYIKPRTQ